MSHRKNKILVRMSLIVGITDPPGYMFRRSEWEILQSGRTDIKIRLGRELSFHKDADWDGGFIALIFAICFLLFSGISAAYDRDEGLKQCEDTARILHTGGTYLENCRTSVSEEYSASISSTNSICGALCILPALVLIGFGSLEQSRRTPEREEELIIRNEIRQGIMRRLESEIAILERDDPNFSRSELSRLRSLQVESTKFRSSFGDNRTSF